MQRALSDLIYPSMQGNLSPLHIDLLNTWFTSRNCNEYKSHSTSREIALWRIDDPPILQNSSDNNASISPWEKKGLEVRRSRRSEYASGSREHVMWCPCRLGFPRRGKRTLDPSHSPMGLTPRDPKASPLRTQETKPVAYLPSNQLLGYLYTSTVGR